MNDGIESALRQARAVAPVLLGSGVRLFERIDPARLGLEIREVVHSPRVVHLRYNVSRRE